MSKAAAIFALAAAVSASYAPTYGDPESSAAPVSSEAPVYSSDPSSSSAWPVSSSAYPASSDPVVYDPSSSFSSVYVPSSSAPYYPGSSSVSAEPSATPTYPACWSACFAEAGITSEEDLCGNVEVDKCIHDTCCQEESWAYWQWYDSYCPAPSSSYVVPSSTSVPVDPYPTSSSTVPSATPSAPVDNCWTDCFAEFGVTSEAELCGNDDVSKCIHDTCCSALDKAYWDWYTGYCVAASTTVYTTETVVVPTDPASTEYTTTYEVTSEYSWSPAEPSAPATGYPVPPPAPAPYTTYPVEGSSAAPVYGAPTGVAPTATGYAAPSASEWAPVPATGAGAVTKPGVLLGAVLAVAALF